MQVQQNNNFTKIGSMISKRLNILETLIFLLFLLSLALKSAGIINTTLPTILLTLLAIIHFFKSFEPLAGENNAQVIFIDKLIWMSLSISTLGILFRLLNSPGYNMMIIIGSVSLSLSFLLILSVKKNKPQVAIFDKRYIIRVILMCLISLALKFTPSNNLVEIGLTDEIKTEITK